MLTRSYRAQTEPDSSPCFWNDAINKLISSGSPIRLIFLDVDGVLNTVNETLATSISSECLSRFCQLVVRTNSHIVISSTWRKHKPFMAKLMSSLKRFDCDRRVIGKTEQIAAFERPREILKWLRDAKANYGMVVENWLAVDDMPLEDMSPATMGGHCCLTTIERGFEAVHLRTAEQTMMKGRNSVTTVTPADSDDDQE